MLFLGRFRRWWVDSSRNIFRYYDGEKTRRVDPYVIGVALETRHPKYTEHLATLAGEPTDYPVGPIRDQHAAARKDAVKALVAIARDVFELAPLSDSGGCTDAEVVGIVTRYHLFMEDLAEQAGPFAG